ncbi:MAG: FHA domain-containing protein, partial [Ktedonobacteraceae bacterium]
MDVVNKAPVLGSLKFLTGPLAGSTLPLSKPITTLGRDETSNDIVISDPGVSRHHARITQNGIQWQIEKLAPSNTVTINSRETQQGALKDRDTIGLGTGTTFLFQAMVQATAYAPPAGVTAPSYATQAAPPTTASAPAWASQPAVP